MLKGYTPKLTGFVYSFMKNSLSLSLILFIFWSYSGLLVFKLNKYNTAGPLHCCPCVPPLVLNLLYPCMCLFCLFSVQACERQAVFCWRASPGRQELLHPMPAPLPALPVVTLGCLRTWQLQRTTRKERCGGLHWIMTHYGFWKVCRAAFNGHMSGWRVVSMPSCIDRDRL